MKTEDGRKFLEEKIKEGKSQLQTTFIQMCEAHEIYKKFERSTRAYQSALEVLTQDTDTPYEPIYISSVSFGYEGGAFPGTITVADEAHVVDTPSVEATNHWQVKPKHGRALDVSNDSPTGIVRQIFMANPQVSLSIDMLLESVPNGLPFKVTRDLIYRIIPRMERRREIARQGRGTYRYIGDELKDGVEE